MNGWVNGLYKGIPYVSGEQPKQPDLIKLNSNENPYPPAQEVSCAIAAFQAASLRLYPRSDGGALREALSAYHGVAAERLFVGNGSDEVLALAFRACFGTGSPIVFPDITYSFYPVWCDFFNIPYRTYPVAEDYRICAADYAGEKGGIVLSNPNAPTSIGEDNAFLRTILDANPDCVVIVDEAYADFAASNAVSLTEAYENLLVVRSFSKSRSLAGIRIGYAIGSERLICALTAAKDSFNSYPLDSIAIAVGAAAVKADADFEEKIARVKAVRDDAAEKLRLLGFAVAPSEANFLFVGCGNAARAKALFAFLRENNILVRYFDKPRLSDHLRISVGTAQDMVQLTACVQTFVQANQ